MRVGFIGFGEAGFSFALGLHEEGVTDISCYDALQDSPDFSDEMDRRVAACGGVKQSSPAEVCRNSDLVIAAVPADSAVVVAKEAAPGVWKGLLYVDVTTATPIEKRLVAKIVEEKGGFAADGAMMGALLKDKHQVPMLLSGKGATEVHKTLFRYHARTEVVEGEAGTATGIKFIRSITAKGISCLLIESLQAAQRFGVEELIVDSFLDSYGSQFLNIINSYVSGAIIHANRREHEMKNVVDFLQSESLPSTMAEATRQKLQWLRDERVKDNFTNGVPREWRGVLEEWKLN
ncbi:MAG: DUF1932 domain-containing protein [Christensenellales bacterium]